MAIPATNIDSAGDWKISKKRGSFQGLCQLGWCSNILKHNSPFTSQLEESWNQPSWINMYPLVNIQKNDGTSPCFMGKSTISMVMASIAICTMLNHLSHAVLFESLRHLRDANTVTRPRSCVLGCWIRVIQRPSGTPEMNRGWGCHCWGKPWRARHY